jgi:oligopeptide/dipeptide ABC transporter ATP-binding protein
LDRPAASRALENVGLDRNLLSRHAHELSGGQRQRAMIAIAIAGNPSLVIADEPTTAVDSVSQVQVLRELSRVQRELGCALIVISHNLGLVSRMADRVIVMYLGHVLEDNDVSSFSREPLHPYARALLAATPSLSSGDRLEGVPGQPGRMTEVPGGCPFHPRCRHALAACSATMPPLQAFGPARAACHLLAVEESV